VDASGAVCTYVHGLSATGGTSQGERALHHHIFSRQKQFTAGMIVADHSFQLGWM